MYTNEELMLEEQGFSWSLSRESLFRFCPRAYFYHYYGSAGGFKWFSNAQQLYQLKKLIPLDLWINSICTDVLRFFFYENSEHFNIIRAAKREFNQGARSISLREWREDPQQLNLFESYYGLVEINDLLEQGMEFLEKSLENIGESGLHAYIKEIPYLHKKITSFPVHTNIGRIRIWCSPVLIWQEDGLLKFLTLNNGLSNKLRARHTAALHKIFAFNKLRAKPERVVTLNFDLTTGETSTVPDEEINVSELIDHVKDSTEEMLALLTDDNALQEDNFVKNITNCPKCRFQKYCNQH